MRADFGCSRWVVRSRPRSKGAMTNDHDGQQHGEHHEHGRWHRHDQAIKAMLRYLRWAPRLWRSDINNAVIELANPQPNEVVIDIGAGLGAGAHRAAKVGASVVAVEPTTYMRRMLRVRGWIQRPGSRFDVVDGSAERLPVVDEGADVVCAVNTMHHWVDPEAGTSEIARVIRPGGRVLLVDEDFEDPSHPEHDESASRHSSDEEHHHGFTMVDATEMGDWLTKAGLVDVVAERRLLAGRPVIMVRAIGAPIH